jgi:Raf kinase inhibitor-like YbhB/YbcL family protein
MTSVLAFASGLASGLALVVTGCSSDSARTIDAGSGDGGAPATMTLTSTAFAEGGAIPVANTCKGANASPALGWSGAPSGTKSLALVLTDLSLAPVLVHWVIYDIPPTATALPAGVDNAYAPGNVDGAHQTVSVHAPAIGYYGPCPPAVHNYQFAIYALDTAPLPGASAATTRPEAVGEIQTHRLDSGTLTGMFTP